MVASALLYLLVINLVTFGVFAGDKRRAIKGGRRVSERALLGLAAAGGAVGAIAGQQLLRHKTRKRPFRSRLWMIAAAQAAGLAALALR